jgi:hypothetical protein
MFHLNLIIVFFFAKFIFKCLPTNIIIELEDIFYQFTEKYYSLYFLTSTNRISLSDSGLLLSFDILG